MCLSKKQKEWRAVYKKKRRGFYVVFLWFFSIQMRFLQLLNGEWISVAE